MEGELESLKQLYINRHIAPAEAGLEKELVNRILERARLIIAHPSQPRLQRVETFSRYPFGELALEETVEEFGALSESEDLLVEVESEKRFSCVAMIDSSFSMSGEKHLLASIAVAVLTLEVPCQDTALILFSSEAKTIKKLGHEEAPFETLCRLLKFRPLDFTNIAKGLKGGLGELGRLPKSRRKVGILVTDGRTTEGDDPIPFAREYDFLVVLHLHGPGSHPESSKELAQVGHGICLEVKKFAELPRRLYDAVRWVGRM